MTVHDIVGERKNWFQNGQPGLCVWRAWSHVPFYYLVGSSSKHPQQASKPSCKTHSFQGPCFDSTLRPCKKWASLWYSAIEAKKSSWQHFLCQTSELWLALLHFPLFSLFVRPVLSISFLHLHFRLDRNVHRDLPLPLLSLHPPLPTAHRWAGWGQAGNGPTWLPPTIIETALHPTRTLLFWSGRLFTHPPCPQGPTALLPDTCSQVIFQLPIST